MDPLRCHIKSQERAFSLLELSIVLVIIGLLSGGVMVGQDLVRQAEFRSVMQSVEKYQTAWFSFKNKYNAFPGDMRNATLYWGIAGGNGQDTACRETVSNGSPATCNGNGDNLITPGAGPNTTVWNETFRAWQHLANAGLIEGSYSGVAPNGLETGRGGRPGISAPGGAIEGSFFSLGYRATPGGTLGEFAIDSHIIGLNGATSGVPFVPIISPQDSYSIDSKSDDGKPGIGWIRTVQNNSSVPTCVTSNVLETAEYVITSSERACNLRFLIK